MGMICYDSTMSIEEKYSTNENNSQRKFIRRLIDQNMNDDSIYIPTLDQQNSQFYHKNQNLLQETQEEWSFEKNASNAGFFRFWLDNYEGAEYILRKKKKLLAGKGEMDVSDRVDILRVHEEELQMSIKEFSEKLKEIKKMKTYDNQKGIINFELGEVVLKNPALQKSIKNVEILIMSPYDESNFESEALFIINNSIASQIQLQGALQTLTTKQSTRQRWSPFNHQIKITSNPQHPHYSQIKDLQLKDIVDAILIKIDTGKDNELMCTTIPISQQLFKHKYPVQQIVKITNSKYSEIKHSSKSEINCISKEAEQIGVILFRVECIRSDEEEDLRQLIELCKTRKNIVVNERMKFEGNSMEESEKSLTIAKFGESFISDQLEHSVK